MSFKSSLPRDLEQAMTAFQVKQNWYEEYWLRGTNDLTSPQVHRRPDGHEAAGLVAPTGQGRILGQAVQREVHLR